MGKFDVFKIDGNTCYNTAAKNGWCYTDKVVSKLIALHAGKEKQFGISNFFQTQSKENWGYCMRSCSSEEETTPDELEAKKNQANSSFPNIPKLVQNH